MLSQHVDLLITVLSVCVSVQDSDVFMYHVIINELLFPDHLVDGMLKNTLLGSDYQVQFHLNSNNQVTITHQYKLYSAEIILIKAFSYQSVEDLPVS